MSFHITILFNNIHFKSEDKIKVSSLCVSSLFKGFVVKLKRLKQENIPLDDFRHAFGGHRVMRVIEQSRRTQPLSRYFFLYLSSSARAL